MEKKKKTLIDPSDQEIRLSFTNYKLLKREEFNLKGSHIYFIKGPNNMGKTSILNALRASMEMKDDTPQKVTLGEVEGINEFTIPGPDGEMYNVVYEFTDATTKFIVFDKDGNKISKVSDMRDIFKYNHVDADSFVSWSRSAEGRRKQKQFILELLPPEDYIKFRDLEVKEKDTFDKRTLANKEAENYDRLRKEYELTSEQKDIQGNLKRAEIALKAKQDELEALSSTETKRAELLKEELTLDARVETLKRSFNENKENVTLSVNSATVRVTEYERQIEELKSKIVKEKEFIDNANKSIKAKEEALNDELSSIKPQITDIKIKLSNLPIINDPIEYSQKMVTLETSISKAKEYIEKAKEYTLKIDKYKHYDELFVGANEIYSALDEEIATIRVAKEDIIKNGDFPVDNLTFDEEGYLYIGGLKFDEKQICESDTILLVAQLLCKMNVSPIQIIGDASVLDYSRLDRLYDIAEANGKIMFVDEIDRELDKLVIVAYERHSAEKGKKPTKKLEFE